MINNQCTVCKSADTKLRNFSMMACPSEVLKLDTDQDTKVINCDFCACEALYCLENCPTGDIAVVEADSK